MSMNALLTWTNATNRQPAAQIFKEGTSAPAKQATNRYKATTLIANVSVFQIFSYSWSNI